MLVGKVDKTAALYLTAPSKKMICTHAETSDEMKLVGDEQDCIFIDLRSISGEEDLPVFLSGIANEKTFIIVKGIRQNRKCRQKWRDICNIESRTVALDLFSIGIIFFDKKMCRWSYNVSF